MTYYNRQEMLRLATGLIEIIQRIDPALGHSAAERLAWELWSILPSQNDNVRHAIIERGKSLGLDFDVRLLLSDPLPGDPDWATTLETSPARPRD